jgi:predicted Zn-dependent peptidase
VPKPEADSGLSDLIISPQEVGPVELVRLPGGATVLSQTVPQAHSVTIGFWIRVGSRDEQPDGYGSTHFLEHLVFKGTTWRGAAQIAASFDSVGGDFNAATAKESTCYYARVLTEDTDMAVDVLTDMVTSSVLDRLDFETERGVILEELAMTQDDPIDLAHEAFAAAVFGRNPLARPIGGTPADIQAAQRDQVWQHYQRYYRPANLVVTATGRLEAGRLADLVAAALDRGGWDLGAGGPAAPAPRRPAVPEVALPLEGSVVTLTKPSEQAQILLGCEGLTATDPRRHALSVLATVLGGGMSSRLFQEIREKRGLAYSACCVVSPHSDAGLFGLYAGSAPAASSEVMALMEAEWERLAADGLEEAELARAKGQLRGSTLLAMEEPFSLMNRLGRAALVTGELPSIEQTVARIEAVQAEEVKALAADLAARPRSRLILAPSRL